MEIYTTYPAVKLYLDDTLVGTNDVAECRTVFTLPYRPGTIRAEAVDSNGKSVDTPLAVTLRRSLPFLWVLRTAISARPFQVAVAANYALVIVSVAIIGAGSSVFHPEASRVAQMASGGRKGLAQSEEVLGEYHQHEYGHCFAHCFSREYGQACDCGGAMASRGYDAAVPSADAHEYAEGED